MAIEGMVRFVSFALRRPRPICVSYGFVILHCFHFDVDNLHQSVVKQVVVEFELGIKVLGLFQLVQLGRCAFHVSVVALEGLVRVLNHFVHQGSFLGHCTRSPRS